MTLVAVIELGARSKKSRLGLCGFFEDSPSVFPIWVYLSDFDTVTWLKLQAMGAGCSQPIAAAYEPFAPSGSDPLGTVLASQQVKASGILICHVPRVVTRCAGITLHSVVPHPKGGDGMFDRHRCDGAGCGAWLHPAAQGRKPGAAPDSAMRNSTLWCRVSHALPGAGSVPESLSVPAASPACALSSITSPSSPSRLLSFAGATGTPCNPSSSLQVLSGCAIIVRGQPRGGPPPERQINLSNIRAGNLARRAAAGQPDAKDTPDEVSASRERCCAAPLP